MKLITYKFIRNLGCFNEEYTDKPNSKKYGGNGAIGRG